MTSRPQPVSRTSQPQVCRHRSDRSYYLAFRKHRHHPPGGALALPLALMPRAEGCQPVQPRREAGYRRRGMLRDSSPAAMSLRPTSNDCFPVFTGRESEV